MTWAARYSRTIEPELTIWRDGKAMAYFWAFNAGWDSGDVLARLGLPSHDPDLRADIAARVDLRECERPGCTLHAIGQGLCVLHGGRDEL